MMIIFNDLFLFSPSKTKCVLKLKEMLSSLEKRLVQCPFIQSDLLLLTSPFLSCQLDASNPFGQQPVLANILQENISLSVGNYP